MTLERRNDLVIKDWTRANKIFWSNGMMCTFVDVNRPDHRYELIPRLLRPTGWVIAHHCIGMNAIELLHNFRFGISRAKWTETRECPNLGESSRTIMQWKLFSLWRQKKSLRIWEDTKSVEQSLAFENHFIFVSSFRAFNLEGQSLINEFTTCVVRTYCKH